MVCYSRTDNILYQDVHINIQPVTCLPAGTTVRSASKRKLINHLGETGDSTHWTFLSLSQRFKLHFRTYDI